jgi:hypothetical protein
MKVDVSEIAAAFQKAQHSVVVICGTITLGFTAAHTQALEIPEIRSGIADLLEKRSEAPVEGLA